jgi:hypothetical protein
MVTATESIFIRNPVHRVFETAVDPQMQLLWDKNFKQLKTLTPGKFGPRYSCYIPWTGKMEYELVEYKPYELFAHRSVMAINRGFHRFEFASQQEGTLLTQTMQLWPRGLGWLLYPFMGMMLRKKLVALNEALKVFLENPENETIRIATH